MKIELKEDERIDDLQYKNLKIIQNKKGFCFGIDSVILSDYAKEIKKEATVIDIGTGSGIIAILLSKKTDAKKIYGIEIQPEVAEMAKKSVKLNNLENKIEIINSDIKEIFNNKIEKNSIDAITINPPYKEKNTGIINENNNKLISRHETTANLKDFIEISSKLLKSKGEFYIVHKVERLVDIIYLMRENKLEPKKIRFVYPSKNKEANLILIKAVKGANKFLKVDKPLYVYKEDGSYTDEILEIYNF